MALHFDHFQNFVKKQLRTGSKVTLYCTWAMGMCQNIFISDMYIYKLKEKNKYKSSQIVDILFEFDIINKNSLSTFQSKVRAPY